MSHYDTTPTDDDRAYAREVLARYPDPRARDAMVADLLGWRLDALADAYLECDARLIARGRALYQLYREESTHE